MSPDSIFCISRPLARLPSSALAAFTLPRVQPTFRKSHAALRAAKLTNVRLFIQESYHPLQLRLSPLSFAVQVSRNNHSNATGGE